MTTRGNKTCKVGNTPVVNGNRKKEAGYFVISHAFRGRSA